MLRELRRGNHGVPWKDEDDEKLLQLLLPEPSVCECGWWRCAEPWALCPLVKASLLEEDSFPSFSPIGTTERLERLDHLPQLKVQSGRLPGGVPFQGWVDGRKVTAGIEGRVVEQ